MPVPRQPKIYHIVHVDRLPSIIADGCLWCDAEMMQRPSTGSTIGMNTIKHRRLTELTLPSHPGLYVGACVPFYFCPRSVMLYVLSRGNHPELSYRGGQGPIIHLEADLYASVAWAEQHSRRWAFTLSNAGSYFFEDRCDLQQLENVDWNAVHATQWQRCRDPKQAEFLVEHHFPWHLVERIGVSTRVTYQQAATALPAGGHRPPVLLLPEWYY
jgi:hypothetical protein